MEYNFPRDPQHADLACDWARESRGEQRYKRQAHADTQDFGETGCIPEEIAPYQEFPLYVPLPHFEIKPVRFLSTAQRCLFDEEVA